MRRLLVRFKVWRLQWRIDRDKRYARDLAVSEAYRRWRRHA